MKLIDVDAFKDWLKTIRMVDLSDGKGLCRVIMEEDFKEAITNMPERCIVNAVPTKSEFKRIAIQRGYVPVVRCKDCKHWDKEEFAEGNLHVCDCPIKDWATDDTRHHSFVTLYKPEDYCSYGERRTDD